MELLDLIATTLPLASAPTPGDMTIVLQGGVLKKQPPLKVINGTVGGSPVVVDMAANGILGSFLLNLSVASGCSIKVETSRDNQVTYQQLGGSDWTTDLSVQYAKASTDVNYVTHVRLTRTVGSSPTTAYTISEGFVAFTGAQNAMIGVVRSKALVVDATTRIKSADPANDRGWLLQSFGIDVNIVQIENYATAGFAWDYSRGDVFFAVERCSGSAVFVNPAVGTDRGTVANQAARVALSAAVVGDYCFQTDTALAYVLTIAGPATNSHWTALPVGAPGGVTISNPSGLELIQDGPMLLFKSRAPNVWTVQ